MEENTWKAINEFVNNNMDGTNDFIITSDEFTKSFSLDEKTFFDDLYNTIKTKKPSFWVKKGYYDPLTGYPRDIVFRKWIHSLSGVKQ